MNEQNLGRSKQAHALGAEDDYRALGVFAGLSSQTLYAIDNGHYTGAPPKKPSDVLRFLRDKESAQATPEILERHLTLVPDIGEAAAIGADQDLQQHQPDHETTLTA